MEEVNSISDLDNMLNGIDAPTTAPAPVTTPSPAPAGEAQQTETPPATVPETVPAPTAESLLTDNEETPEQFFKSGKQNAAFAQMRTENKSLRSVVDRLSKIMGVPEGQDLLTTANEINRRLIDAEAKETSVPAPILQELDSTKQLQQEQELELRRTRANLAFQEVAGVFKLSKQELKEFAIELMDAGKNPFTEDVDLMSEYKIRYFDKELKKAQDNAVRVAAERQASSAQHSTQPISTVGAQTPAASPVQSVADLNRLLDSRGK